MFWVCWKDRDLCIEDRIFPQSVKTRKLPRIIMVLQCRYYLLNIFNILRWITKYFHSIQDYLKKDVWYNFAFLRSNIRLRQLTRRGWDGGSTTTLLNSFAGEINFWNFFTPDNFCSFLYKCHLPWPIWQLATLYNENWGKFGHVVFVQAIIVR